MPVLAWKHGTTKLEARKAIKAELRKLGHDGRVTWEEFTATARVGPWGTILDAGGEITEEEVRLEKCGGAIGGVVLHACRSMLAERFPGGESG
jgi:hypothetical protein